jgi:hypothetical protein
MLSFLKIEKILEGQNWDKELRYLTEVGINVRAGLTSLLSTGPTNKMVNIFRLIALR